MNPKTARTGLLSLTGILALALGLALAHRLAPHLETSVETLPASSCNLQLEACSVVLPGEASLRLAFSPRPVVPVRPFRIEAIYAGGGAVAVEFTGADMDMGRLAVDLVETGQGRRHAETSLPVCTTGRMAWLATVKLTIDGRRLAIPFRFYAPEET